LILLNLSKNDSNNVDVFDFNTKKWSKKIIPGKKETQRSGYTACATTHRGVIIYGGENSWGLCNNYLNLIVKREQEGNKSSHY